MKTIILAAGKATRLLPMTKKTPQCLLDVKGKPILKHQLDLLSEAGVEDVVVVCGYQADKVETFCKKLGVKTLLNPFYGVSSMAMTLWLAREELKNGFMLVYSDILFDSKIISGLLEQNGTICLAIQRDGLREEAEKIIEKNGIVESIGKVRRHGENGEFIGIAKFSENGAKEVIKELDGIAKVNLNSTLIETVDSLIKKGETVTVYDIKDANFIDIDFPEDLKKAEDLL